MKKRHLIIPISILVASCGIGATIGSLSYALYERSQEIRDDYQKGNLQIAGEELITTFTLELHHASLTNNYHGQYICMIFFQEATTEGNVTTYEIDEDTTKVVGLTCNYTWDNVTMYYNISGLSADYQYAVMARCAPGTSPNLTQVDAAVNAKDRSDYANLWTITNPVNISQKAPANDVYRVYNGTDSYLDHGYYHLEFNPEGTPNHVS